MGKSTVIAAAIESVQKYTCLSWKISKNIFFNKENNIAKNILNIGVVCTSMGILYSLNSNVTFIGFSFGSYFFYSPVCEILNDFSPDALRKTAKVALAVVILLSRIKNDSADLEITLTIFSVSAVLGVYTHKFFTPMNANRYIPSRKESRHSNLLENRTNVQRTTMKTLIKRVYSISLTILSILLKSLFPTLVNRSLSYYGPKEASSGFWCGFILHRYVLQRLEDLQKNSLNREWIQIIGGAAITSIICFSKKELVERTAIFVLSALMGTYTYRVMYKT